MPSPVSLSPLTFLKVSPLFGCFPSECRGKNLFFSTEVERSIRESDVIFVSVNTPTKISGLGAGKAADLKWIEKATRTIADVAQTSKIVVEKSTVPCKTAESMRTILESNSRAGIKFQILSNPEFLAEGTAMKDLEKPDRVLIGSLQTPEGLAAQKVLADLYAHWVPRDRIITMNLWSSELSKLVWISLVLPTAFFFCDPLDSARLGRQRHARPAYFQHQRPQCPL